MGYNPYRYKPRTLSTCIFLDKECYLFLQIFIGSFPYFTGEEKGQIYHCRRAFSGGN